MPDNNVTQILSEKEITEVHLVGGELIYIDGSLEDIVSGKLHEKKSAIVLQPKSLEDINSGKVPTLWIHNTHVIDPAPPSDEGYLRLFVNSLAAAVTYPYRTQTERDNLIAMLLEDDE